MQNPESGSCADKMLRHIHAAATPADPETHICLPLT